VFTGRIYGRRSPLAVNTARDTAREVYVPSLSARGLITRMFVQGQHDV